MTEPERTGGKTRLVLLMYPEYQQIEAAGLGGPKLYTFDNYPHGLQHFCEPAELERWRAARAADQAGDAHQ